MGDIYWIWILRYWLKYVRYCLFVLWFLGLDSEGIYRVSGFSDDIEALKDSFDKGIFKETLLVYATVQLETIGLPLHLHRWAFYIVKTLVMNISSTIALDISLNCLVVWSSLLFFFDTKFLRILEICIEKIIAEFHNIIGLWLYSMHHLSYEFT